MIAVGEASGAIVLVFDRASKQQTLTDAEARSLHAQLALLIQTRARPASAPLPVTSSLESTAAPDLSKPAFKPLIRRKPVLNEGKRAATSPLAVDDASDDEEEVEVDPVTAARKLDEDEMARRKATATG